jgi:hypothetical protein
MTSMEETARRCVAAVRLKSQSKKEWRVERVLGLANLLR